MSSHREAPEISKDPVADSTDVYAFVSPKNPDMVTLIANYIPFQKPHHPHVAVVDRPAGDATIPSLVFPEVVAGEYELVPKDGGPVQLRVRVDGGAVTTVDWG